MNLKEYILTQYPSLSEDDIELKDDGEGVTISLWNSDDPKPSDEQVRQWEQHVLDIQRQTPPKTEVEALKEKLLLMQQAMDDLILGGGI